MRCAVPAFMRVEPAIGSAPVSSKIGCSASSRIGVPRLLAMPMVSAPRRLASRRQASVNGVVPLAATAISTSSAPMRMALDQRGRVADLVLGAFHRPHQRLLAAGHQQQQPLRAAS